MSLATVDAEGHSHCRIVLLCSANYQGYESYTHYNGDQGLILIFHM